MSDDDAPPLAGRIALVTGASRGLGRAAVLTLTALGANVVAAARNVGALEALDDDVRRQGSGNCSLSPFDLLDEGAIERLGGELHERHGVLDIFVGNAGVLGPLSPASHIDPDAWRQVLDVNLTANWRAIRAFEPLLRSSTAGRAVFLTSGAAVSRRPYWSAYCASKAALEALVASWAAELKDASSVRANALNPGRTRTEMHAQAFPGAEPSEFPTPEEVMATCLPVLCSPDLNAAGKVFAYDEGRLVYPEK